MGRVDLQALPRFSDGWTFLYVEHARIEKDDHAIIILDEGGRTPVPVAALAVLLLGPGTVVTHAAMGVIADNGASVVWCGEGAARFYASGLGESGKAANLLAQATAWADPEQHMQVVMRMYRMRFAETLDSNLTIEQIRGKEGVRVREAYARASRETGLTWSGRAYRKGEWNAADPVNRALSTANACLYGLCHAAIISAGFSPGLGFIHTGKPLAFVYDVADLYKCDVTVPLAFRCAQEAQEGGLEGIVRRRCREAFRSVRLLDCVLPDIQTSLGLKRERVEYLEHPADDERIIELWSGDGAIAGGRNFARPDSDSARNNAHEHAALAPEQDQ